LASFKTSIEDYLSPAVLSDKPVHSASSKRNRVALYAPTQKEKPQRGDAGAKDLIL
jgi:hypothetical protein